MHAQTSERSKTLRILHFNDVYNVSADVREPVGGATRFAGLLNSLQDNAAAGPTLTLFSGDAFFPSLESTFTMGDHMRAVLNELRIDASVFGNHEFDKGVDVLEGLTDRCNFPWLITNLVDTARGTSAVRNSLPHLVKEVGGVRVGIIGIIEKDWLDTLPAMPPSYKYVHYLQSAQDVSRTLRDPAGAACDLIICLTHMRLNFNIKLAEQCPEIDLILSGHDHFYYVGSGIDELIDPTAAELPEKYMGYQDDRDMLAAWTAERAALAPGSRGNRIIISGTDFRDMSEITLHLGESAAGGVDIGRISVLRRRVTSKAPEAPAVKAIVEEIEGQLSQALDRPIGFSTSPLDARSSMCRMQEATLGNLSSDLMRAYYAESTGAHMALFCGGTIRSDKVFPAGVVRLRELAELFPFTDPVVVIKMTGEQIRIALENGVSKWPAHDGRFPHVSGLRFEFDPTREPGNRITSIIHTAEAKRAAKAGKTRVANTPTTSARTSMSRLSSFGDAAGYRSALRHSDSRTVVGTDSDMESDNDDDERDGPLDKDAVYTVVTRDYMYRGYDGYAESMRDNEAVVDDGISFSDLYQCYFRSLQACNALWDGPAGAGKAQPGAPLSVSVQEDPVAAVAGSVWRRLVLEHAYLARGLTPRPAAAAAALPLSKHAAAASIEPLTPIASAPIAGLPDGIPAFPLYTDGRIKNVGGAEVQNFSSGSRFNTATVVHVTE
ncbi:hypothetical protein H4R18_001689 [Coemansia javaensis]|uniref:Metallo-dependent phosphatase n=1 Tax=Coemansia javaensis TaxID=2761396 RepID=A0A9W8HE99_9FUNG|nr:hypothetical protein H4R18_001689 [Coemansia javaensis]